MESVEDVEGTNCHKVTVTKSHSLCFGRNFVVNILSDGESRRFATGREGRPVVDINDEGAAIGGVDGVTTIDGENIGKHTVAWAIELFVAAFDMSGGDDTEGAIRMDEMWKSCEGLLLISDVHHVA